MKVILYILILVGSTVIGNSYSKKHHVNLSFYRELISFINTLESQIKFKKNDLKTIVKENIQQYNSPLKKSLSEFFILNKKPSAIEALCDEENVFILTFFKSLGKTDTNGEIDNLNFYKQEVNNKLIDSTNNFNKLGDLGTKLGFIAGLLIVVVLL